MRRSGRRFSRLNLLEALATMHLRALGLKADVVRARVGTLDEDGLRLLLVGRPTTPMPSAETARVTLGLLARGLIDQYRATTGGAIVGVLDDGIGRIGAPKSLRQAMARLSRLYFEEGKEDRAASVHQLIFDCTTPLSTWAPESLVAIPEYREAVLVDGAYGVPSEDCDSIAEETAGVGLADMLENHLHSELQRCLDKMPPTSADVAYSTVREFVGRHPMASDQELRQFYANPDLTNAVIRFVERLYEPVHADFARGDAVPRCKFCRGPVGSDRRCLLQGCREDHPRSDVSESVPIRDAFVVKPEVLKFWVDPAREELRLYDYLVRSGMDVRLYPHRDRCDVALADDVGIDVKDYRDPARLARRLNRSLGGLAQYPRRIVAIADRRDQRHYLDRLRELLTADTRASLELTSVTGAIRLLGTKRAGKGRRARAS